MQPETPSKPKGLSGAEVAKAAELVNYQDGAIFSREIVKKPTGNVTIFAFDEGQGLSEHTAPFDALAPWNSHRNCGSSRSVYSTGRVHVLEGEAERTRYETINTENRTATINPTPKSSFRRFPNVRKDFP
jgi:hypothetical protein